MVLNEKKRILLAQMVELLELPDTAYEKAEERYRDLGEWFGREESACRKHDPYIFPQGSFRLGTAIRPLDDRESYDLDLGCRMRQGMSRQTQTQYALKLLVGNEIELYRTARGINKAKEEKHRCWRLEYADKLSFHMDIVPSIPAEETSRKRIYESMKRFGEDEAVSASASQEMAFITDNRREEYKVISDDWIVSNTEGYAKWFVARMNLGGIALLEKAKIDQLPLYKRKTVLQRAVQILKRHRDQMFKADPDIKPISIIITTLAARAYQGEPDIESALVGILSRMGGLVNSKTPRVPNPVNFYEDFADRWSMPEYAQLELEKNFWEWLTQAKIDFDHLGTQDISNMMVQTSQKFAVRMDESKLRKMLGPDPGPISTPPKIHTFKKEEANRPWLEKS